MSRLFGCLLFPAKTSGVGYIPCCTLLCTSSTVKCCSGTRALVGPAPSPRCAHQSSLSFSTDQTGTMSCCIPAIQLHQLRNYVLLSTAVLQRKQQYNKSVYNSDLPWLLYFKYMREWKRWGKISLAVGNGIHGAGTIFHVSACFPFYSVVILKHWIASLLLGWRWNTLFKVVVIHLSSPDLSFGLAALLQLDYRTISL